MENERKRHFCNGVAIIGHSEGVYSEKFDYFLSIFRKLDSKNSEFLTDHRAQLNFTKRMQK